LIDYPDGIKAVFDGKSTKRKSVFLQAHIVHDRRGLRAARRAGGLAGWRAGGLAELATAAATLILH